jgi:hypothetical protein
VPWSSTFSDEFRKKCCSLASLIQKSLSTIKYL